MNNAAQKDEPHSFASGTETEKVFPMSALAPSVIKCSPELQLVDATLSTFLKWLGSGRALA